MALAGMKVSRKLAWGFGAVLVLLAIVAAISYRDLTALKHEVDVLITEKFAKTEIANDVILNNNLIARAMRNSVLVKKQSEVSDELDRIANSTKVIKADLDKLESMVDSEAEKASFKKVQEARASYSKAKEHFLDLISGGKRDEAVDYLKRDVAIDYLLSDVRPLQDAYIATVSDMIAYQTASMEETGKQADAGVKSAITQIIVLAIIAVLAGVSVGFVITRSITGPLQKAVKVADAVAKGDLTSHIEAHSNDEAGQLLAALKRMNDNLAVIVNEVRGTTDSIRTASQEIAAGNTDLSQRTEDQASSLEQTASSMEQLSATVKQNAQNARQANQMASNASDVAARGGQMVNEAVETMASISASSKKIVDIIGVIEGIAFQTNILALNAAVEAARAGEQGRGFAVVAAEVRNLAQRAAAAAKEIKTLINDSVDKVETGAKQVNLAGGTMNEVVSAVKQVTDIMSEIAAASNEQSAGIEQVNQAITQMDNVTQQNAALVEEAAAAAESMQEQAASLSEAVSIFKLEASRQTTRTTATRPIAAVTKTNRAPALSRAMARLHTAPENAGDDWKEF